MPEADRLQQLTAFAAQAGVSFQDLSLLDQALTHSSFTHENPGLAAGDNERLEYLGDAILGFLVAEWLYARYPSATEGELTRLRVYIVRGETLAAIGRQCALGRYLLMGRGEAANGGQDREANLAGAVEALTGAMYLDGGMEQTRRFVQRLLETHTEQIEDQRTRKDPKTYLQEYTQSAMQITPAYAIVQESGPQHRRTFQAQVLVNGVVWGTGTGSSKQAAEQGAARAAIRDRSL
ncbi:MAG: ribonuclease III [Anaerolineae bacterium]|jgi:ribonuclease-3|nr:ribonuclease III [Chloroflexota bacterium]